MRSSICPLLLTIAMVTTLCGEAVPSSIAWMDNLKQATAEAARQEKPMLVKVSTEWCGYCKKMDRDTFSNKRVAQQVNHCFVAVEIDGMKERDFVKRTGVRAYPTTLVVTPKMAVLKKITGYRTAAQLSKDLNQLCSVGDVAARRGTSESQNLASSPFGNNCPVSPLEDGRFLTGKSRYPVRMGPYRIYFHSQKHRQLFQQNPSRYWPVADGKCVVGLVDESTPHDGKLNLGLIYADRVWLFSDESAKRKFEHTPERYRQAYLERFETRRQIR